VASWPGRIEAGTVSDQISVFYDLLPTLCEVAGTEIPEETDGLSFLPTLLGEKEDSDHQYIYWEFPEYGGQIAIRMGKWKGWAREIKERNAVRFELYDLESDPLEEHDLADTHPEIIGKFRQIVKKAHEQPAIESFRMIALGDSIP
jgi:arylsulfatase